MTIVQGLSSCRVFGYCNKSKSKNTKCILFFLYNHDNPVSNRRQLIRPYLLPIFYMCHRNHVEIILIQRVLQIARKAPLLYLPTQFELLMVLYLGFRNSLIVGSSFSLQNSFS